MNNNPSLHANVYVDIYIYRERDTIMMYTPSDHVVCIYQLSLGLPSPLAVSNRLIDP